MDYNLMTTIPGLYALGECNFSDDGANRLGASALMQGLADGYFILPATIGDYLATEGFSKVDTRHPAFAAAERHVNERITQLLAIDGRCTVDEIHRALGKVLWDEVGMVRNASGLQKAQGEIRALREEFWRNVKVAGSDDNLNASLEKAGRVADFLELGELMAIDALQRDESCGSHFRTEHQTEENEAKRDDQHFAYVSAWEYRGVDCPPQLHQEALPFEYVAPSERNYK